MVCLLCDSNTNTTNSRYTPTNASRWRRHTCPRCSGVFTTRETIDFDNSYQIRRDKKLEVFCRDKLFVSILDAVAHRPNKYTDARALTETILANVAKQKRLIVDIRTLVEIAGSVLIKFDRAAYARYISIRPATF
jgi:transcriptional regulator NrdR family protein